MADQNLTTNNGFKWCYKGKHFVLCDGFARLTKAKDGLQSTCKECRRIYRALNAIEISRKKKLYQEKNKERISAKQRERQQTTSYKAYRKTYRQKNAGRINQTRQAYCENNKERVAGWQHTSYMRQRDKLLIKFREYRRKNKNYFQTYAKKYYSENRDKIKNRSLERYWADPEARRQDLKAHYEANKARYLDYGRNRRARRRNAAGKFTRKQWLAKCDYWGWRCYLCNSQLTLLSATVDHRTPLTRGGSNWIANIAPACFSCNASKQEMLESEYRATRQTDFLRRRSAVAISQAHAFRVAR